MQGSSLDNNQKKKLLRNEYFQKALGAEKLGDEKKALEHYRMSLQIDSSFFDSWLNAGAIYSRQGKTEKAIQCYRHALSSKIDKRVCYNLASEFFKIGKYDESRKLLHTAIKEDHYFIPAHLLLGYVYGKLNANDKSEISIKNVLKIDPNNKPAMTALALLYYHTARPAMALRYVRVLLENNPKDTTILKLLANIEMDRGQTQESIKVLKDVSANDPKLQSFYKTLSQEMNIDQSSKISLKRNEKQKQKVKNAKDFFDLSILAMFDGEPEKAMDYLEKAYVGPVK